ncbi:hypothetical protein [Streptomyces sp. NPDC058674]|uniref:hypothetical protein n=1 Tax=Streptomyces sp. NPDC058674 TaxID=3346592 RepID=UPI00365998B3
MPVDRLDDQGECDPGQPRHVNGPDARVADIAATHDCAVRETAYEAPGITDHPVRSEPVCPLCRSLDRSLRATCGDTRRKGAPSGAVVLPTASVRPLRTGAHGPLVRMAGCVRLRGTSS